MKILHLIKFILNVLEIMLHFNYVLINHVNKKYPLHVQINNVFVINLIKIVKKIILSQYIKKLMQS
jgi:hypothetical protein